jgi:acyl-[acyl-carrier-protein] desaturase
MRPEGPLVPADLEAALYRPYRAFFERAERKRRWSLRDDIPWGRCNRALDPAVTDVVESFCAVELYLPDYVRNAMSVWRPSRACAMAGRGGGIGIEGPQPPGAPRPPFRRNHSPRSPW